MIKIDDVKKWNYDVVYDNTDKIFKEFNEIYLKNREAARYFIIGRDLSSTRIVSFTKKHVHIVVHEHVSYGVSITLKRYKSTKTIEKYYVDTKTGSISKSVRGKFIPAKISDVSQQIKKYIISKMKWIEFVFESNLPITFNSVVRHKLYSKRKLLSWYWGTDYKTAIKINEFTKYGGNLSVLRNNKHIKNINNINTEFFKNHNHHVKFMTVLHLSTKCRKTMNAAWSFKRLKNECKKLNRIILDVLFDNYDFTLKFKDVYLPIITYLKNIGYEIPKTVRELSKLSNNVDYVNGCIGGNNMNEYLILKKDGVLFLLADSTYGFSDNDDGEFCISSTYSDLPNDKFIEIRRNHEDGIKTLNKKYETLLKVYSRKNKMLKLTKKIQEEEVGFF